MKKCDILPAPLYHSFLNFLIITKINAKLYYSSEYHSFLNIALISELFNNRVFGDAVLKSGF